MTDVGSTTMSHRLVTIGRSRTADIRLQDRSVSRMHAELIVAARGLLHIADRSSANGTWVGSGGAWKRVRQHTVRPSDRLRFGRAELTAAELLSRIPERPEDGAGAWGSSRSVAVAPRGATTGLPDDGLPRGRVRRNPLTGEVVRE